MGASFAFLGRIPFDGRWSARHHLAARISERYPVVYLEDPVRFPGGLLRDRRPDAGGNVASVRPLDYPLQRIPFARRSGARSAAQALRAALPDDAESLIAVVYPQASLEVLGELRASRVVYHALDDLAERYDGRPDRAYLEWEAWMLGAADLVLAITTPLAERLRDAGARRVEVLPLGFDERLFGQRERPAAHELARIPGPRIGFAGTVRPERIDLDLVTALARERSDWSFVFVGPLAGDVPRAFRALRNIHVLGPRDRATIPQFVAGFDVVLAAYRDCRVNRGCYPLKAVEGLAMGVPVVYTPARDDLVELAPHVLYAGDAAGVARAVERCLAEPASGAEERARSVLPLAWGALAERHLRVLLGTTGAGPSSVPVSGA